MDQPPTETGYAADAHVLATTLQRVSNRADLLTTLRSYLLETTQPQHLQLMWQVGDRATALYADQPTMRQPTPAEHNELAAGQVVEAGDLVFLPLLVLGTLRGWIVLQAAQRSAAIRDVVLQAGLSLAVLERVVPPVTASRELTMMDQVGRLLSSTLQLDRLLPNLATIVRELIVAHDFYIALLDDTTNELSFAYFSSYNRTYTPEKHWSIQSSLTGVIIQTGQAIVTDDYHSECRRRGIEPQSPDETGFSYAWLGVPLAHHNQVLGVIVAGSDDPALRYSEADVQLLRAVAAQAAAAVANAQLYERVTQQAHQLEIINRIGRTISATLDPQTVPTLIVQELQAALDAEDGALLIEERASGDLVVRSSTSGSMGMRLPRGVGIAGNAMRHGELQIVHDVPHDPRAYAPADRDNGSLTQSIICAPFSGPRLRGVIQFRNKRHGMFNANDAQLVQAVAEQAAVALDNAELYAHTDSALDAHVADLEQRNQQLTNLVALSNALRATTNIHEIAQHIVAAIRSMTDTPHMYIGLIDTQRQQLRAIGEYGLDPTIVSPRRELTTPLNLVYATLPEAEQIGMVTYHLGQHWSTPVFDDCIVITLLDPQGTMIGVIGIDQAGMNGPFSTALINELEIVANHAAIAIVNARIAAEQSQTVDRLTALSALSLALTTAQLSTDETMQMTVRGAMGTTNGLAGGAYVQARDGSYRRLVLSLSADADTTLLPLLTHDTAEYIELIDQDVPSTLRTAGILHVLIVPVRGAKLTIGALWIGYADTLLAPTEREMVVLYAKTAGAVLENLRLFDQVRTAHDRLASILASTTEGMLMATAQGQIAAANTALIELLGLPHTSLDGLPISDVYAHPALATDHAQLQELGVALHDVAQGRVDQRAGEVSLSAPMLRDLAWTVLPIQGNAQQHAALLVLRDVTAERQTEKLRQDLANMIVHDLRAPLTNMMVSIDLLLKQISGPLTTAQQRIIQIAGDSSQQMLDLVNALLDIRRLEQRKLELEIQPVEIYEVVESVFERLERIAAERHVQLHNNTASLPAVAVDINLVRRVLQNLIDNATKFSPRHSRVDVCAFVAAADTLSVPHAPGRWAVIEVRDQGPGVPESYRSLIFELFGQAPQGRGQGTGLGLAFCKLAIAAHGGTIWIEDAPEGGAVFRFTMPLA